MMMDEIPRWKREEREILSDGVHGGLDSKVKRAIKRGEFNNLFIHMYIYVYMYVYLGIFMPSSEPPTNLRKGLFKPF